MPDRDFSPKDGRWFFLSFELADAIAKAHLGASETSVLFCVMRFAYPRQRAWADLKFKFIMDYTELSKTSCYRGIELLTKRKILAVSTAGGTYAIKRYRINSKISSWKKGPFAGKYQKRNKKVPFAAQHPIKEERKIKGNLILKKRPRQTTAMKIDPFFIGFANDILANAGMEEAIEYCDKMNLPHTVLEE